ncbi:MAG: mCpol domain-containing protein, partial [Cyanobacteria bacterium P01_A01_bin.68]
FKQHELEEIKEIYKKSTKMSDPSGSGLTCSIGYGRTLTETYLALKIAKTQPGKNSIFGFKLADKGISKR